MLALTTERNQHPWRIKEVRRAFIFLKQFFREDLVKSCEPRLSLVCYHSRRGWGKRSVSLFHSSWENNDTAYCRTKRRSQRKGGARAALYGRQPASNHHQPILRHHRCLSTDRGARACHGRGRVSADQCHSDRGDGGRGLAAAAVGHAGEQGR